MEKISIKSFGLYLMSALISCLLIATVVTMCSSCVDNVYKEKDLDGTLVPDEGYEGWDYCGFYINNVIDTKMSTTADGDEVYWAVYTDLDAEFDNAVKPTLDEAKQWLECNRSNYLKEDSLIYEESYEKATKIS